MKNMENKKDFQKWNDKKQLLHYSDRDIYFRKGEIWWCALGVSTKRFLRRLGFIKKEDFDGILMAVVNFLQGIQRNGPA